MCSEEIKDGEVEEVLKEADEVLERNKRLLSVL